MGDNTSATILHSAAKPVKEQFSASRGEWRSAIFFMLSMSLTGLGFPPGYLLLAWCLINSYNRDRHEFIIQITMFFMGAALVGSRNFPFKLMDAALVISVIGMFIYRKSPLMKKVTAVLLAYVAILFVFASFSDESMKVQFVTMRTYLSIFYIFVPLMAFSGHQFDLKVFSRKIILYSLVMCAFYAIDGFVLNGWILVPNSSYPPDWDDQSWFYAPIFFPFDYSWIVRKYPVGLYILALALIPVIRYYKLSKWQWLLVVVALLATRTMTVIAGLILVYVIFQGNVKRLMKYGALMVVALVAIYFIDGATGGNIRVKSTVDQFVSLETVQDDEDLAEFGSSRMAQVLPKMEHLFALDCEWVGFGFLHPELTTNSKYQIENELYTNIEKADEYAIGRTVEVTQITTILDIGILGFLIQLAFYILLYWLIRYERCRQYYSSVLVSISVFGLGGFAGLNSFDGLSYLALAFAVAVMDKEKPASTGTLDVSNQQNVRR